MSHDDPLGYMALRRLATGRVGSQRSFAEELGVSLGKANYIVRALVARGLVSVENVSRSPNRLGYAYLLTPKGVSEKERLTRRFLKRKVAEYERLQQEIDVLAREAGVGDIRTLAS